MSDVVRRLATEQRRRFVAGIMGAAEQSSWWSKLSTVEQKAYRDKVMTSVGVYHDFMLDVIKVTDDDGRNELALELIEKVYEGQRALERKLTPKA